jgi:amino acid adenylation domain-containing protein/non-ribosomal peptide synthase protein (TIGR01720 family)/FkbM family methyltransferase
MDVLKEAVRKVINRQEVLRTTFRRMPGMKTPLQVVADDSSPSWENVDLTGQSHPEPIAIIEELFREEKPYQFDFERGPLLHLRIIKLSSQQHALIITLPSICADAQTLRNLINEIGHCYALSLQGSEMHDEVIGYIQFSEWQNELITAAENENGRGYWSAHDFSALEYRTLPFELRSRPNSSFQPKSLPGPMLSASLWAKIKALAQSNDATAEGVLLACWALLLWRLGAPSPLLIATLDLNRPYPQLCSAFGLFAQFLPTRLELWPGLCFTRLIAHTTHAINAARAFQPSFIWEQFETPAPDSYLPYCFALEEQRRESALVDASLRFTLVREEVYQERFKLWLRCVADGGGGLRLEWHFDASVYDEAGVGRLASYYERIVESAVGSADEAIERLELVSEEELRRRVDERNQTNREYEEGLRIEEMFRRQAERTPTTIALTDQHQHLSYQQLNSRANRLAHYLQGLGVGPESIVGLLLSRTVEMVVSVLGVLKAGGAYLPLDEGSPEQRLGYMLGEAGAEVVITERRLMERICGRGIKLVVVDEEEQRQEIGAHSGEEVESEAGADNLAYVIYTSGSTGRPKAVMVTHRSVVNYLSWCISFYHPSQGEAALLHSPLSFDLTVTALWSPLMVGQSVQLVAEGLEALAEALSQEGRCYSLVKVTPTHLRALRQLMEGREGMGLSGRIKVLVVGGEALAGEHLRWWRERGVAERIINEYGPSETVVGCMAHEVKQAEELSGNVPIGTAISNMRVYVLGERQELLPEAVTGEMYVAGAGVARGYLQRPELTAERFLPDPYGVDRGARMYRTGDLGRYIRGGEIEYLGRRDEQVKVRGYRIELGEIEEVIREQEWVREVVVVVREAEDGVKRLVAYLVPFPKLVPTTNERNLYRLPNGLRIAHINKNETDLLYQDIFVDRNYLKHGINITDGDCVFDVGANIGLFTLFAHQEWRAIRIYAFEPLPPIFDKLQTNINLYGANAHAFNCGLSNESGTATFIYYPKQTVMSGIYADAGEDEKVTRAFLANQHATLPQYADDLLEGRFVSESFRCQLRTLSEVISENSIEQINLLKIDVEKSELDVLMGIRDEDWKKIKQIVMEVHDIGGRLAHIVALLKKHGYRVVVEQETLLENTGLYNIYSTRDAPQPLTQSEGRSLSQSQLFFSNSDALIDNLREYLQEKLPAYMLPSEFVLLDTLPLTTNGKVDRRALLTLEPTTPARTRAFVAPRTPAEQALARIWADVLGAEQVSIDENFFELGGDSILSIQIIAKARRVGLELTPKQVFQHQTVKELAAVAKSFTAEGYKRVVAARGDTGSSGDVILTPIQRWFFEQELIDVHHFNQAVLLTVPADFDAALCARVLAHLQTHHDALRLRFTREAGAWHQYVSDEEGPLPFSQIDVSTVPEAEQRRAIEEAAEELQGSLDLSAGPLWRAALFRLGEGHQGRLLLIVHHLAIDSVSWRILLDDLQRGYRQASAGEAIDLGRKTSSYRRWATALREYASTGGAGEEVGYWLEQLAGASGRLPVDYESETNEEWTKREVQLRLSRQETRALLTAVPRTYGTQINEVLLTALARALGEWMGRGRVVVDMEGHGREEVLEGIDLTSTVGWFTAIYPVSLEVGGEDDEEQQLKSIKEQMRRLPKGGLGYGVLRYLSDEGDEVAAQLQVAPQAELSFNYLGQLDAVGAEDGVLRGVASEKSGRARSARGRRRYLLEVDASVLSGELRVRWVYSEKIHERATVEALAKRFMKAARVLIEGSMGKRARIYKPTDFPLSKLSQPQLNQLAERYGFIEDIYPLSPTQQGILFHTLYARETGAYYVPLSCALDGELNVLAFKQAWEQIVQRHPALRHAFVWDNVDEPIQVVCWQAELAWEYHNWQELSPSQQQERWKAFCRDDRRKHFDLSNAPLMRLFLAKIGESTYQFLWSFHHLLLDGWSIPLLLKEFFDLYEALCRNSTVHLQSRRPYKDYIEWLLAQDMSKAKEFWQRVMQGFSTPTYLATSRAARLMSGQGKSFDQKQIRLSMETTIALQSLARRHHLTLNTLVQGAWAILLRHYTGQQTVVFGATVSGRPPSLTGSDEMVGLFINTLPVIVRVADEVSLMSWLKRFQEEQAELRQYEYTPLVEIQKWSDVAYGQPLFDNILVFENYPVGVSARDLGHNLKIRDIRFSDPSHYSVTVTAGLDPELLLGINYDGGRFDAATIESILANLETIFSSYLTQPDAKPHRLEEILADAEQQRQVIRGKELEEDNLRKVKSVRRKPIR